MHTSQDAMGHMLYDYLTGQGDGRHILYVKDDTDSQWFEYEPTPYFNVYKDWHVHERQAMRFVRGRVLDIGCGAGRHALYLQEKGHDVLGIDASPLAIEVCKLRGLHKASVLPIHRMSKDLGLFDTILMLGNNFGLCGTLERAKRYLKRFERITNHKGRLIVNSHDTDRQIRLRFRYKTYQSSWMNWLLVSHATMDRLLEDTVWTVRRRLIRPEDGNTITIIDKR